MLFRYLGVRIYSKKISVAQCDQLIEKMVIRIRIWTSRNLSYTTKVQLVNIVLMSLHIY